MSVKLKETNNAQASLITQNFRGFFSSSTNHFLPVRSARIVRVVGSKGRRRRSFFDRESSIFRRTKPRPATSFFSLQPSGSLRRSNIYDAFFLFSATIQLDATKRHRYTLSTRAFKAPPREPLSCSCGHFLSLRILFSEYLSSVQVDARSVYEVENDTRRRRRKRNG